MGVVVVDDPPDTLVKHGEEGTQGTHPRQLHDVALKQKPVNKAIYVKYDLQEETRVSCSPLLQCTMKYTAMYSFLLH